MTDSCSHRSSAGFADVATMSLTELAASIPDGATLATPFEASHTAMAATWALIARGARRLHLVCVPVGGMQADVLIGAGALGTLESSAVTMGEMGAAHRFVQAVREGSLRLIDATCPAVYAALEAGQKGIPFIPLRGLIGSDLLTQRADWTVIDDPFTPGERVAVLRAIRPDVALFHAECADREGNVFIGRSRALMTIAQASQRCLVTVERIVEGRLLDDEARGGAVLPSIYVTGIAHAPRGAWPLWTTEQPDGDEPEQLRYQHAAATADGFERYLAKQLDGLAVAA